METIGLSDGSVLVICEIEPPPSATHKLVQGTLSLTNDMTLWIVEAMAAGATFDVLKQLTLSLNERGWHKKPTSETSTESVTRSVIDYLYLCGYGNVSVTDAKLIRDAGWTFAGTADDSKFSGIADLHGNLIHIHVR